VIERQQFAFVLPPDPWWPRRVPVVHDGDCVPFHLMLLWHWQFLLPARDFTA
jgi:hypothetical protein